MSGAKYPRTKRPFRFGTQQRHAPDAASWRDLARRAEDLGYSTLFLPDHFHDAWSPFVPLAVAAEATTALNVGTLVLDNDFRHPLLVAREAAALDLLTEGRFELGIGAGWLPDDYEQAGIPMDPPGVRISRLAETAQLLKQLWRGETVTADGDHYRIHDGVCEPRPHRAGGPPLIIGGGGRRILSIAARYADIIGIAPELTSGAAGPGTAATAVRQRYLERVEWIRAESGERFDSIELQVLINLEHVGPGAQSFIDTVASAVGLAPDDVRDAPITLAGTVEAICDQLEQRRETYGFSYVVVRDMDLFAPVVDRLRGR